MKKLTVLISMMFAIGSVVIAQTSYKVHTIKDGETLSQLASRYGTTVGDIMRLNGMNTGSKLSVGEKVKIPSTNEAGNISSEATPDTHVVEKGETLYQISHKYHVTVSNIRDWNNIADNTISVGQTLRLKPPIPTADEVISSGDNPSNQQVATVTPPKTNQSDTESNTLNTKVEKQRNASVFDQVSSVTSSTPMDGGAFGTLYASHANGTEMITKGSSGTFQSSSGWKDQKYFVLMNEIAPGSVVKVQANGKTVYAKVLWNLGNVPENAGLSYRISDAAAKQLDVSGDKFDLIVSYYK